MPDDNKGWAGAVPEMYFDLIARIAPGGFLVLVIFSVLAERSATAANLHELEWGPSVILLVLLLLSSYAVGLLISPLGISSNRKTWRTSWGVVAGQQFELLKRAEVDLNLSFKLPK